VNGNTSKEFDDLSAINVMEEPAMKIKNHLLVNDDDTPFPFVKSPNIGGAVQHKFLVLHFTAGRNAQESVGWLTSKKAKASAHVVIGRDGSITQLVPFNRVAWHAGASSWEGFEGLNQYSLGIELDNAGRLTKQGNRWRAWFGTEYGDSEVIVAVDKFETEPCGWHAFTPEQIDAALNVAGLLIEKYGLSDVLGHEDITPHRKCDPGPAFPIASFRARLMGRAEDQPKLYETTTELNIRTGPGAQYPMMTGSPLQSKAQVRFVSAHGNWWLVDVIGDTGPLTDMEGWVNSRYLERLG
jgi:N-acetylmuramoyl-L-alanine amidase